MWSEIKTIRDPKSKLSVKYSLNLISSKKPRTKDMMIRKFAPFNRRTKIYRTKDQHREQNNVLKKNLRRERLLKNRSSNHDERKKC